MYYKDSKNPKVVNTRHQQEGFSKETGYNRRYNNIFTAASVHTYVPVPAAAGMIQDSVFGKRDGALTGIAVLHQERSNIFRKTLLWKQGVVDEIEMLPRQKMFKPEVSWWKHNWYVHMITRQWCVDNAPMMWFWIACSWCLEHECVLPQLCFTLLPSHSHLITWPLRHCWARPMYPIWGKPWPTCKNWSRPRDHVI